MHHTLCTSRVAFFPVILVLVSSLLLLSPTRSNGGQADEGSVLQLIDQDQDRAVSLLHVSPLTIAAVEEGAHAVEFVSARERSPFPFNALGVKLDVERGDTALFKLFVRTSSDFVQWGEWIDVTPENSPPDQAAGGAPPLLASSLLFRDRADAIGAQVKIHVPGQPGSNPSLSRLEAVFIDSTRGPSESGIIGSMTLPEEPALPRSGKDRSRGTYPKPPVVSRAQWGADPPQGTLYWHTVTHICLHHTASVPDWNCQGFDDCAARVRATQDYHMSLGWTDIGYNYLVCKHGLIWEGRYGGDDVVGAHDAHNWGSMGVSSMGYFHPPYNHDPTAAMLDSLAELFAWKCDQRSIDPLGSGWYYGYGGNMDTIYGHRQVGSTACPGDNLYNLLPAIRSDVEDRLSGGSGATVLDTDSALRRGVWNTGTMAPDKYGSDYLWTDTQPGGNRAAGWRFSVAETGTYDISVWWSEGTNRTTQAKFAVRRSGITSYFTRNQQQDGGQWNSLGSFHLVAGARNLVGVLNDAPSGYVVICDAVRIEKE